MFVTYKYFPLRLSLDASTGGKRILKTAMMVLVNTFPLSGY